MDNPQIDIKALLSPPDILKCRRVLCIQPHPDDNEIGMGGTVAVLAQTGCEVHYLTVTNGDKGNKDKQATPEQTAAIRRKETVAAGRHLGASEFHFLDKGDGTLSDISGLAKEITSVMRKVEPDAVFCPDPWLFYEAHYDHIVTGRASAYAFTTYGKGAIGYYFTSNPNTVIDISSAFDRKFEAIALHDSQMQPQTLEMYRIYFGMKAEELANGNGFALGEGLKVLSALHSHCFVDAIHI